MNLLKLNAVLKIGGGVILYPNLRKIYSLWAPNGVTKIGFEPQKLNIYVEQQRTLFLTTK
jgi:hypothetical protein